MEATITERVVKHLTKVFTVDEIRGLDTFFPLIPAPGTGKVIIVREVTTVSKQGNVNYGAQPLSLKYGDASGEDAIQNELHWGVLNCSHDKITSQFGNVTGDGIELDEGFDKYENLPVGIVAQSQPTQSGDGLIRIEISYVEHELATS